MFRFIKILLVLVFSVTGCTPKRTPDDEAACRREEFANVVMYKHIKFFKNKGYNAIGTGGAYLKYVNEICITYLTNHSAGIPQARREIVELTEHLINLANNDSNLVTVLKDSKFIVNNSGIIIGFNVNDGNLSSVMTIRDTVIYTINSTGKKEETIYEEPYEEAKRIVFAEANRTH